MSDLLRAIHLATAALTHATTAAARHMMPLISATAAADQSDPRAIYRAVHSLYEAAYDRAHEPLMSQEAGGANRRKRAEQIDVAMSELCAIVKRLYPTAGIPSSRYRPWPKGWVEKAITFADDEEAHR